jgi:hypothetical protein
MIDTTLYAQWNENTYVISGSVEDGNGDKLSGVDVAYLKRGILLLCQPSQPIQTVPLVLTMCRTC